MIVAVKQSSCWKNMNILNGVSSRQIEINEAINMQN